MKNKKVYFIYNPVAGKQKILTYMQEIEHYFLTNQMIFTKYATKCTYDAYHQSRKIVKDYDVILVSGGDGTLNEVVNALLESDIRPYLMYLPTGTTNDFGKTLNLSSHPIINLKRYFEQPTIKKIDIGKFNNLAFTYVAAFGSISEVSYTTPQHKKKYFGRLAYIQEGLKQFFKFKTQHLYISHDTGVYDDDFFLGFISNAYQIGGFEFFDSQNINLSDGYFECVFVKKPNNPLDLQRLLYALMQREYHNNPFIYTCQTSSLLVHSYKPLAWTIDGEHAGSYKHCYIKNIQQAIQFII